MKVEKLEVIMLKVIIADDEEKVCKLIYNLVNWEELDMKVVSIAQNGIEALEQIKLVKPDIVITDIRMPGYDGLELIEKAKEIGNAIEFIIVSGHSEFEYAQVAIRYGVIDYILKPIKKEVLIDTLYRLKERYRITNEKLSIEEMKSIQIEKNKIRVREEFLMLLMSNKEQEYETFEQINGKYYFNFRKGKYQCVIVNVNSKDRKIKTKVIERIRDKVKILLNQKFYDVCYDIGVALKDDTIYCILNYTGAENRSIKSELKEILKELALQKSIFGVKDYTIGIGRPVEEFSQFKATLVGAEKAVAERIIIGTGKVIDEPVKLREYNIQEQLHLEFDKEIKKAVDNLDIKNLNNVINGVENRIINQDNITGNAIFNSIYDVFQTCIFVLCKRELLCYSDDLGDVFLKNMLQCNSVEETVEFLQEKSESMLTKVIEKQKNRELKPVRLAKEYIQINYMQAITLEKISKMVGFNASYFSVLFKKQAGINFLEYLSVIRIDKAKGMLKESNDTIVSISNDVGYKDVKSFNKNFKKYTGLKPNEFRKLYS